MFRRMFLGDHKLVQSITFRPETTVANPGQDKIDPASWKHTPFLFWFQRCKQCSRLVFSSWNNAKQCTLMSTRTWCCSNVAMPLVTIERRFIGMSSFTRVTSAKWCSGASLPRKLKVTWTLIVFPMQVHKACSFAAPSPDMDQRTWGNPSHLLLLPLTRYPNVTPPRHWCVVLPSHAPHWCTMSQHTGDRICSGRRNRMHFLFRTFSLATTSWALCDENHRQTCSNLCVESEAILFTNLCKNKKQTGGVFGPLECTSDWREWFCPAQTLDFCRNTNPPPYFVLNLSFHNKGGTRPGTRTLKIPVNDWCAIPNSSAVKILPPKMNMMRCFWDQMEILWHSKLFSLISGSSALCSQTSACSASRTQWKKKANKACIKAPLSGFLKTR